MTKTKASHYCQVIRAWNYNLNVSNSPLLFQGFAIMSLQINKQAMKQKFSQLFYVVS